MTNGPEKKPVPTHVWVKEEKEDLLEGLLDAFPRRPRDDGDRQRALEQIRRYYDLLVKQTGRVTAKSALQALEVGIAEIDSLVSKQVNEILHAPEFKTLEAAWRGLHQLVANTETSNTLKIKVLNVSKDALFKDFEKATEFTESALWKKVYSYEFGVFGGDPFGVLIGDYEFGRDNSDVSLLEHISMVAAASHAPFISGTSPEMFSMDAFTQLPDPRDLSRRFDKTDPHNLDWLAFRKSEDSRFIGLCMPHVLMRRPYGKENRVETFNFHEDVDGSDDGKYLWGTTAYAFVNRLTDSFAHFGWCAHIRGPEGGGLVTGLPTLSHKTDEGDVVQKCPTEILMPDDRAKEIEDLGFIPLCHAKNTTFAAFFAANSVNQPKVFNTDYATKNARLSSRLEYLLVSCRIAHYLKSICRDKIGSFITPEECQKWLQKWIDSYVLDMDGGTDAQKAERPLRKARIEVVEDKKKSGYYKAVAYVQPHYILDEIDVALMLVADLPPPAERN